MRSLRYSLPLALALLFGVFAVPCANAEDREQEIKAAYLFSFTKYVTWPEGTFPNGTDPIVICVLGDNPFDKIDFAERLRNRTAEGRPVQVKFAAQIEDIPTSVHVLFVAESNRKRMDAVFKALKGRAVLTVSDISRFSAEGGMIGFVRKDNAIRFEVNTDTVDHMGIKLSSNLLKLAQIRKGGSN